MYFFGLAVEIAGLGVPVLALAFVHREFYSVAIGEMERGVFVEDSLDIIIAGGNFAKAARGIAEGRFIECHVEAGSEAVHVSTEELRGARFLFAHLEARFGVRAG